MANESDQAGDQALRSRIDALLESKDDDQETDQDDDSQETDEQQEQIGIADEDINAAGQDDDDQETDQDEDDQETDQDDDDQETDESLTAKDLAEKLGVNVKDIYKIKFPYGRNGESLSLGELKDVGIRARDLDSQTTQLESDREAYTNDKMVSRAEMQNIISLLPEIPQQLVDQAQAQYRNVVSQERVALMETIPAWSDPAKEKAARTDILTNLKTYGFTAVEMDHMLDHRLVKLLDDFTRLKGKLVKPKSDIQAMKKGATGKKRAPVGSRKRQSNRKRSVEMGKQGDTRGAINTLLDGV